MKHNSVTERLNEADKESFALIFMRYYPKVKLFINYMVKSEAAAEDISQDIFEHLWKNRKQIFIKKSLDSYLLGMARNKSCNYLTRKIIEKKIVLPAKEVQQYLHDETVDLKDLEMLVMLEIEKMPPQRRRVFKMSRFDNMKNSEIAEKLNISKKTVENHINHAIRQIREAVNILSSILFF